MNWEEAKRHFDETYDNYLSLVGMPGVNVNFALRLVLDPLLARYNTGERTEELYNAMLGVE